MIPALLTCAFVIYLYLTLNAEDDSHDQPETSAPLAAATSDPASVNDAIADLDRRVRDLTERHRRTGR
jgi:hypothetical protein